MKPASLQVIDVEVNGRQERRTVGAGQLLVHFIRDTLGLTGTHIGCDTGNCGACTVHCDGQAIKSCMMLAVQADDRAIETVESLAQPEGLLDVLQACFSAHHALQCGYCTPGMMLSAKALLERNPDPTEEEIRRGLKGNICRCTGYVNIVQAVQAAAERRREDSR